jgi:CSLREA domain-containing protein
VRRDFAVEAVPTGKARAFAIAVVIVIVLFGVLLAAKPAHAKTFTVNHTGDAEDSNTGDHVCDVEGFVFACSLRAAIQQADITDGPDIIFNIPAGDPGCDDSGVCTIAPDDPIEPLPRIDGPLTINGYSQPGAKPNSNKGAISNADLKIELDGIMAADDSNGVFVQAKNCVVKGLVINRFEGRGILLGSEATGTKVQGNFIGTDPEGTSALGNLSEGVRITGSDNLVGGSRSGPANVIAFNGGHGVQVSGDASVRNRILRNSILHNDVQGIELGFGGETPNDNKDTDTGPNNLQNKPVLTSAVTGGNSTTIQGTLNSTPNKTFTIQFFSNPPDSSDEGLKFIGQKSVSTNANGNASFSFSPAQKVPDGQFITATATNKKGNASEFSDEELVT